MDFPTKHHPFYGYKDSFEKRKRAVVFYFRTNPTTKTILQAFGLFTVSSVLAFGAYRKTYLDVKEDFFQNTFMSCTELQSMMKNLGYEEAGEDPKKFHPFLKSLPSQMDQNYSLYFYNQIEAVAYFHEECELHRPLLYLPKKRDSYEKPIKKNWKKLDSPWLGLKEILQRGARIQPQTKKTAAFSSRYEIRY